MVVILLVIGSKAIIPNNDIKLFNFKLNMLDPLQFCKIRTIVVTVNNK
jgi:hypothetical protein